MIFVQDCPLGGAKNPAELKVWTFLGFNTNQQVQRLDRIRSEGRNLSRIVSAVNRLTRAHMMRSEASQD